MGGYPPMIEGTISSVSFGEDSTAQVDLTQLAPFDQDNTTEDLTWEILPANGLLISGSVDQGTDAATLWAQPDSNGSGAIWLKVSDPASYADSIEIGVTVFAVDDAPLALNDTVSTNEDTPAAIFVLANDTDADGDTLRIDSATQGSGGGSTIIVDGATSLTYFPELNFFGADSFTYIVNPCEINTIHG